MRKQFQNRSEVILLGPATGATRGAWGLFSDEVLMHDMPRLSKD